MDKHNKRHSFRFLRFLLLYVCSSLTAQAAIQYTDATQQAGINGNAYGSSTNHVLGMCWIDYDNDGWPDIFAVNGIGYKPHLFHNSANGTFTKVDALLPSLPNVEMAGCVFADYDNDGDSDIYIQTHNERWSLFSANPPDGPSNLLLKNLWVENGNKLIQGQALFQDVAAAANVDGVGPLPLGPDYPARSSMTGGWLDYNRDGCIDLFVGQMILQGGGDPANTDTLYKNNCDGSFSDVTVQSGVNPGTDPNTYRPGLAFIGAHLDADLWPDMVVVNVHEPAPYFEDFIYRNNRDGTFSDITGLSPGVGDDAGSGMGIDVGDLDNNGTWDIYITDVYGTQNDAKPLGNVLYWGNGDGTFQDNTAVQAGVDGEFSWGVNFMDVDQDGFEDICVSTTTPSLYENNRDGTFTLHQIFPDFATNAKGSAMADYDRDGDLDVAVVNEGNGGSIEGGLQLFRNDSTNKGHWLQLKLVGSGPPQSNRDAIGAVVKVSAGGLNMMRQIKGGSSAHSQDSLVVHFGLGTATTADTVDIMWPSGLTTPLINVVADTCYTVTENGTVSADNNCSSGGTGGGGGGTTDPLSLTAVSPNSVVAGSTVDMVITGAGIVNGASVLVCRTGGATTNSVIVQDAYTLLANVSIATNAPSSCGVTVTNPDGNVATLGRGAVTVTPDSGGGGGGTTVPLSLTAVSPNSVVAGSTVDMVITGAGIVNGASVLVCRTGGATTNSVIVQDANTLLANVSIATNAPSRCGVTVTNPDGNVATLGRGAVTVQ